MKDLKHFLQINYQPILLFVGLLFILFFTYTSFQALSYQYPLNHVEGSSFYFAQIVLRQQPLYSDINTPPFILNSYPPLYPMLGSFFLHVSGNTIFSLRTMNIIFEVLIAWVVYKILRLETKNSSHSFLIATAVLGLFSVHKFHAVARLDMVVVFFSMYAFYQLVLYLQNKTSYNFLFFLFLSTLAFFTKQTSIFLIATYFLYVIKEAFLYNSQQKRLIISGIVSTVLIWILILQYLNYVTHGEYYLHVFLYQTAATTSFYTELTKQYFVSFFMRYWVLFSLWIGVVATNKSSIYTLLSIISTFVFFVLMAKEGSDLNYSLEPIVLYSIVVGLWTYTQSNVLSIKKVGLFIFCIAILATNNLFGSHYQNIIDRSHNETETILSYFENAEGRVLTNVPLFAMIAHKQFLANDSFALHFLSKKGFFDEKAFVQYAKSQDIEYILLEGTYGLGSMDPVNNLIDSDYKLVYKSNSKIVYDTWTIYQKK